MEMKREEKRRGGRGEIRLTEKAGDWDERGWRRDARGQRSGVVGGEARRARDWLAATVVVRSEQRCNPSHYIRKYTQTTR